MEVRISLRFSIKLEVQLAYIAEDKPGAAVKFQKELIKKIRDLAVFPYRCKVSHRFNDPSVRELIFKGYSIFYRIHESEKYLVVFGFAKHQDKVK